MHLSKFHPELFGWLTMYLSKDGRAESEREKVRDHRNTTLARPGCLVVKIREMLQCPVFREWNDQREG